jgi:hypothetical protein
MLKELLYVDMTPEAGLAARILETYRLTCNSRWSSTPSQHDSLHERDMRHNEEQRQRAKLLDDAIATLKAVHE